MKLLDPSDVLRADGSLTLTDGNSYFVFLRDGAFHSFPLGLGGRTFEGTWTSPRHSGIFTVEATAGWVNGLSTRNDYRKIVFAVSGGDKRPAAKDTVAMGPWTPKEVWTGYFIIDELTKIKTLTRYSGFSK